MTLNLSELKSKCAEIDDLVSAGIITKEKGDDWKARYLEEFEQKNIPVSEKRLPNDLAHLPGRLVEIGMKAGKRLAEGSANTYVNMERLERSQYNSDTDLSQGKSQKPKRKVRKDPDQLLADLPEQYR